MSVRTPCPPDRSSVADDPADLLLACLDAPVVERIELPPRPERTAPVPASFTTHPALAAYLQSHRADGMLWLHQARALEHIAAGEDVLITTATGSGKSLVFQAPVLREMLEGDGTAIVFYPQKALASDQLSRWRAQLAEVGLAPSLVAEVNGDVDTSERAEILATARVLLVTPDVAHAWLVRAQTAAAQRSFLSRLRLAVIDEAHAFDGVFGTNSAFFFRRLELAAQRAAAAEQSLRFIAASATIGNPAEHLEQLTGRSFAVIGNDENGAPGHAMTLLHIEGPDHGSAAEAMLADAAGALSARIGKGAFVGFVDGRQPVERITRKVGLDTVLPYRSGYEAADRRRIEQALAAGTLRGCVATSALELGIDFGALTAGFTLGVPPTRKSLAQRAGRVGRAGPGVFAVIAPRNAFTKLGTTFAEYAAAAPEPAHLYLANRMAQFQQACCLHYESGGAAFDGSAWPAGFAKLQALMEPGAPLPPDLVRVAQYISGAPHFAFPLRQVGDPQWTIEVVGGARRLGTIPLSKAMREAFVGATYLHFREAYRVVEWRRSPFGGSILVKPAKDAPTTHPLLSARVEVSPAADALIDGHLLESEHGSIAERWLNITQTVYGYSVFGKQNLYADLAKSDRRMRARHRQFETSGIVIRIREPWFAGPEQRKVELRKRIALALRAVLLSECGILAAEVDEAHSQLMLATLSGGQRLDDAIAVYDSTQGSLRLTEPLFASFPGIIDRLARGVQLAGEDTLLDGQTVERLKQWYASLEAPAGAARAHAAVPATEPAARRIFAPGSELGVYVHGDMLVRRVTGHRHDLIDECEQLMYSYELPDGAIGWVSHDRLLTIGSNWSYLDERIKPGESPQ